MARKAKAADSAMIGADTNILLRSLLKDDLDQVHVVESLFTKLTAKGDHVYVSIPVLTETVFVLFRVKKKAKQAVIAALRSLLDVTLFVVDQEDAVREALETWEMGTAGFNDYLIGALNQSAGCSYTTTFDSELIKTKPSQFKLPN